MDIKELWFRGTQVAYAVICKRKLWLFSKGVTMEHTSDRVALGKLVDEESFKREKRMIDENVSIDFYTTDEGVTVHEVKLSKSLEEAHELQVKYYIYYLRSKEIPVTKGIIHYPKMRRIKDINLSKDDCNIIEQAIKDIAKILALKNPPPIEQKPYCKKCAYFEFCYG